MSIRIAKANWVFKLLILVTALSWPHLTSAAGPSLIGNGGFEEWTRDGTPASGWWLWQGTGETTLKADTAVAHSGKHSARLQTSDGAKCAFVSPKFNVAAGDEIAFESWARTQDPGSVATVALAFRDAAGRVFGRQTVAGTSTTGSWALISGAGTTPPGAITAELHLGCTNTPAILWYDDVAAVITSPVSLALLEEPKTWTGRQDLRVRVTNRQSKELNGSLTASVGKASERIAIRLRANASQEVALPVSVASVGQHSYRIDLADANGKSLRRVEGKFRTNPGLVLYPPCPYYQRQGAGTGRTLVEAKINLSPAARPSGLKMRVQLLDPAAKVIQSASAEAAAGSSISVHLDVPLSIATNYTVAAALVEASGKELAAERSEVRVAPSQLSIVQVGPDGFLRVGSQPQFPIGMYSCGQYPDMGRAGFTGTHNYGITTGDADEPVNPTDGRLKELLDQSWACGMRMMVELPRKAIEKARWTQVRRRVETFKYHPGLLCWGSEERVARGEAPLKNIRDLYQLVRQLDPDHPLVLGDTKDVIQKFKVDRRDFFPDEAMDIGIWWWYPIPIQAGRDAGLETLSSPTSKLEPPPWLITTLSKKPLWIAIQAYQKPQKGARYPTPEEYRCQAYLSIVNGVKGLWFYTGSGQRDFEGKPAGLLNKLAESHWDYVQKLVRELHDLSPVFMQPRREGPRMTPADAPVQCSVHGSGDVVHLIIVNQSLTKESVQLTSPEFQGRSARTLFEPAEARVSGDTLAQELPPLGVRVLELKRSK